MITRGKYHGPRKHSLDHGICDKAERRCASSYLLVREKLSAGARVWSWASGIPGKAAAAAVACREDHKLYFFVLVFPVDTAGPQLAVAQRRGPPLDLCPLMIFLEARTWRKSCVTSPPSRTLLGSLRILSSCPYFSQRSLIQNLSSRLLPLLYCLPGRGVSGVGRGGFLALPSPPTLCLRCGHGRQKSILLRLAFDSRVHPECRFSWSDF